MHIHEIAGDGEVGRGLHEVLTSSPVQGYHQIRSPFDVGQNPGPCTVLHVCFPDGPGFVDQVREYMERARPKVVIVHSTVDVGTTRKLGRKAVHSPVRGKHPNLAAGLRVFTKYIGANDAATAALAKESLSGMDCKIVYPTEATELAKILSLSRYGLSIAFAREQDEICDRYGLDYQSVVTEWEQTYNEGLRKQNQHSYRRPMIFPPKTKIGGHCVLMGMEKAAKFSGFMDYAFTREVRHGHLQADHDSYDVIKVECPTFEVGRGTKIWNYANIMDGAIIGEDCTIGSYVEIGPGVFIGDRCKIEARAFVPNGVYIGNEVFVGPGAVFTNDRWPRAVGEWAVENTVVEDGASVGAGSVVKCGVRIGMRAMIGCGSVVTKDVPAGEVWYGNPARCHGWVGKEEGCEDRDKPI